jgi:hypothetical protein
LPGPGWQEFAPVIETPPGVIEVATLRLELPVADVPVAVWRHESGDGPQDPDASSPGVHLARTGRDGLVAFRALAPGRYGIRAWFGAGEMVTADAVVDEFGEPTGRRIFLRAGSGSVHGRVFSGTGAPRPDASVRMIASVQRGHSITRMAVTDSEGSYRFDGVPRGFILLVHQREGRGQDRARFLLEEGESLRVDLGAYGTACEWAGNLVTSEGTVFHPDLLDRIHVDERNTGNEYVLGLAEDRSFSIELPAGEYIARTGGSGGSIELARVRLDRPRVVQDAVVPGVSVTGKLSRRGSAPSADDSWNPGLSVTMHGVPAAKPIQAGRTKSGFLLLSLERRVYELRPGKPWAIADSPSGAIELDLTHGPAVLVHDLELEER